MEPLSEDSLGARALLGEERVWEWWSMFLFAFVCHLSSDFPLSVNSDDPFYSFLLVCCALLFAFFQVRERITVGDCLHGA